MGVTLFPSVFAASAVLATLSVEVLYLYAIKFPSSKYQCTNGMTVELQITDSVTKGYRQGLMKIDGKLYPGLYWTRGVSSEFNGRGSGFGPPTFTSWTNSVEKTFVHQLFIDGQKHRCFRKD